MTVAGFLKACLNGPREPSEHPALPVVTVARVLIDGSG
jgi:hypothetical protein